MRTGAVANSKKTRAGWKVFFTAGICMLLATVIGLSVAFPALADVSDTVTINGTTYTYFKADLYDYDITDFNTRSLLTLYDEKGLLRQDVTCSEITDNGDGTYSLTDKTYTAGTAQKDAHIEPIFFYDAENSNHLNLQYDSSRIDSSNIGGYGDAAVGTVSFYDNSAYFSPYNRWTGRSFPKIWSAYDYLKAYHSKNENVDFGYLPYLGLAKNELVNGEIQFNYAEGGMFTPDKDSSGNIITDQWNDGKILYQNVSVPFENTADGYYTLDSSRYHTYFDKSVSGYNIENRVFGHSGEALSISTTDRSVGLGGLSRQGFFPFNDPSNNENQKQIDYAFGMTFSVPFYMTSTGKDENNNDIVFKFTGDDDIWVFVDGKLALDIGGIHNSISGEINFTKGLSTTYYGTSSDIFQQQDISALLGDDLSQLHTLSVFYMERGANVSNCRISFNLPTDKNLDLTARKEWTDNGTYNHGNDSVSVTLYRQVENGEKEIVGTQTLSAANNWEYTWSNLRHTNDSGKYYTYTVEEAAVNGYTPSYSPSSVVCAEDMVNGHIAIQTITNTPTKHSVTVNYVDEAGNPIQAPAAPYTDVPYNSFYNVRNVEDEANGVYIDYRNEVIPSGGDEYYYIRTDSSSSSESGLIDGDKTITYVYSKLQDPGIAKDVDPASCDITDSSAAHTLTYTVTISNPNNFDIYNVSVSDPVPAGTKAETFVSCADSEVVGVNGENGISWVIGKIGKGQSATLKFNISVDALTQLTEIDNTAYVNGFEIKPYGEGSDTVCPKVYPEDERPSDSAQTELYRQPTIEKFIETGAQIGDTRVKNSIVDMTTGAEEYTIVYSFVVSNPNSVQLTNVTVSDVVPEGLSFHSSENGTYSENENRVQWTIGSVPANGASTVSFVASISDGSQAPFINNGSITGYSVDPDSDGTPVNITNANISSDEVVTTVFGARPSIEKATTKDYVSLNEIVPYTLTVSNNADIAIYDVTVSDQLPEGLSFAQTTPVVTFIPDGSGVNSSVTVADGKINVVFASLDANARAQIVFDARVTEKKTQYVNQAFIDSYKTSVQGDPQDPVPSNEVVVRTSSDPYITKSVNKEFARKGDTLHYTLAVTNPTSHTVYDAVVSDQLPAGVTLNEGSVSINGTSAEWNNGSFTVSSIAAGATANIEFDVTVTSDSLAVLTNTGTLVSGIIDVAGNGKDDDITTEFNTTDDATTTLILDPGVTKSVDKAVAADGETVTYSLTVTNPNAGFDLRDVCVTDAVPEGLTLDMSSVTEPFSYNEETRTITWIVDCVEHNAPVTVSFKAVVTDRSGAVWENIAYITEATPDVDNDGIADEEYSKEYPDGSNSSNKVTTDTRFGLTVEYRKYDENAENADKTGDRLQDDRLSDGVNGTPYDVDNPSDIPEVIVDEDGTVWVKKYVTETSDELAGSYSDRDKKIVVVYEEYDSAYTIVKEVSTDGENWFDTVQVNPGTDVFFRIVVTNNTGYELSGLTLSDELMLDGESIAYPTGWQNALNALSSASIDPYQSWTSSSMSYTVPADASAEDLYRNVASVNDNNPDTPEISDDATVTVNPIPGLEITKSASIPADENGVKNASQGAKVPFTLIVRNTGNCTLTNINVIDDTYDVEYNGTLFTRGTVLTVIESLAAGEQSQPIVVYYTVPEDAELGSKLDNYATAKTLKENGDDDLTSTDNDEITVVLPSEPRLSITKTVNNEKLITEKPGEYVTYTITVTNSGGVAAENVFVSDYMLVDNNILTEDWAINKTWVIDRIEANSSYVIEDECFRWQVPVAAKDIRFDNTAEIYESEDAHKNGDEPIDTDSAAVIVGGKYSIDVTKAADVSVLKPGDTAGYVIYVTNSSNAELTDITVTESLAGTWDEMPEKTSDERDVQITVNEDNTLTIDSLAAGDSVRLLFSYDIPETTENNTDIINTVTAEAQDPSDPEGDPVTDSADAPVRVEDDALVITKTANCQTAFAGSTVTYTITVTNTGKTELKNVVVTDDKAVTVKEECIGNADGSTTPVRSDLSGLDAEDYEGTIIGFYPTLGAGECRIITVEYVIPENTENGEEIINTANAKDDNGHDVSASDDVTVIENPIEPVYKLEIVKTANVKMADEGDTITYTITVTNAGNTDLNKVVVTDSLDVSYNGTLYPAGNIIKTFETLGAGKSETILVTYTVPKGTKAESVVNTATADSNETESVKSSATVIMERPAVEISKTVSDQSVAAGDRVYYTLTVTNTGNVELTDLLVADSKVGYSTTIAKLAPGEKWTSPANTLYYTFGNNAATGTTFKNDASVSNEKVMGATDTATTVTTPGNGYSGPNTGDPGMVSESKDNSVSAAAAVTIVAACAVVGSAIILRRRNRAK